MLGGHAFLSTRLISSNESTGSSLIHEAGFSEGGDFIFEVWLQSECESLNIDLQTDTAVIIIARLSCLNRDDVSVFPVPALRRINNV